MIVWLVRIVGELPGKQMGGAFRFERSADLGGYFYPPDLFLFLNQHLLYRLPTRLKGNREGVENPMTTTAYH